MPRLAPSDLARRCAAALLLTAAAFGVLIWAGFKLAELISSDDAMQMDLNLARWMGENISAGHAWRNVDDGQRTFARLRSLPGARVLREPALRGGRTSGDGSWIVQSDGFLVHSEARGILSWVEGRFKMGATAAKSMYDLKVRNSSVAWCTWRSQCGGSAHVQRLLARVEGALGIGREHFEDLQIVRYYPGEFYREHMDVPLRRPNQQRRESHNPRILVHAATAPSNG